MGKKVFSGGKDVTAKDMHAEGLEFGISLGRRAPMHSMHVDCILEILESGLKPVIVIGSADGPESPLYDPVRNPMTVEQQKDQFRHALSGLEYDEALILTLEDNMDDGAWLEGFVGMIRDAGVYENAVVHFRSKAADAAKANEPIKPLSQYTEAFVGKGFAVWQSYNNRIEDDSISATDIRGYDLENLTPEQRRVIAAPDYLIDLARTAREGNPDQALLKAHHVPLTVLDLAFDRLHREAGIATAEVIAAAKKSGDITLSGLAKAATDVVKKARNTKVKKTGKPAVQKPLLLIGNSVSPETAAVLKQDALFDVASASIGKFQSGEPFVELFYGEKGGFEANAEKIKGAKVFVVQSTAEPVGDNVQYLLEMVHTLKLYGAAEVTAVVPFLAFSRQDRPFQNRFTSVAADLMAKQLKAAGADKVVSFTMHSQAAIQQYKNVFDDQFTALSTTDIFAGYLKNKFCLTSAQVVSGAPDGAEKPQDEGQKRAQELAIALTGNFNEKSLFKISKVHTAESQTKITGFEGDVAGKDCIIIDDMIDGGGTMLNAARILKEHGAKSVTCCITHPILTKGGGTALEKLMTAQDDTLSYIIDSLVMTDAIPEAADKVTVFAKQYPALAKKIEVIALGPAILAEIKKQLTVAPAHIAAIKPRQKKHG